MLWKVRLVIRYEEEKSSVHLSYVTEAKSGAAAVNKVKRWLKAEARKDLLCHGVRAMLYKVVDAVAERTSDVVLAV